MEWFTKDAGNINTQNQKGLIYNETAHKKNHNNHSEKKKKNW